jgi:carbonic anhydrase
MRATTVSLAALRHDLPASLVVFLVALPLSLGIAQASNAPLVAGVIAAVVGGLVAGALGGAPLQVSGPAAGLTALVFQLAEQCKGDWRAVTTLIVLAGILQGALGALGVARWALAISPAVVHGMLAGIGALIALGQLHVLLGAAPSGAALLDLQRLPASVTQANGAGALLGLATAALIFAWPMVPVRALRAVPAPLAAIAAMTLASLGRDVPRIQLAQPGGGALLSGLSAPVMPDLPPWDMAVAVLGIALIASVESLLSAVATDKLHDGPRARLDRELLGQGAANAVSGLLGGLPITGVIVRSKANIDAGARTRASAILHGVWVLLFVTFLGPVVEHVPRAVLAGLLITVGIRLVNLEHIRDSLRHGEGVAYVATITGILAKDLLSGVALGFVVGAVVLLRRLTAITVTVKLAGGTAAVRIDGALTFRGVPELTARLREVPPGLPATVDLNLSFMDHAGWEALHAWKLDHEKGGGEVTVDGMDAAWSPNHPRGPGPAT